MAVVAAILPVIIVALFITAEAVGKVKSASTATLERLTRDLAAAIDQELANDLFDLALLARTTSDGPTFEAQRKLLSDMLGAPVVQRDGEAVSMPRQAELLRAVLKARESGRSVISNVIIQGGGIPVMVAIVMPIQRPEGITTIEVLLPCATMGAALRRVELSEGDVAALVDPTGRIAAATGDGAQLVGEIVHNGQTGPSEALASGEAFNQTAEMLRKAPGWRVISRVGRDNPLVFSERNSMAYSVLAVIVATALSLGLVTALGGQLSKPLQLLAELARNVAMGNDSKLLPSAASAVAELETVRLALLRADAVLRRRGAAERMALREARTQQELLVSVLNGTTESIYVKDLDLRYVLVNRAALLSGTKPQAEWQVLGRDTAELFPPSLARRIEAADRTVLATGQLTRIEQSYVDPYTGQQHWLSMTTTPWQDAEGRVVGVVTVGRDITESRQAEVRLRGLQADLLRTTRLTAMGAMGSGLAHELNQPLAAATNFLNAGHRLLERASEGDMRALASAREAVAEGARQMLRAGAIVRRLRDFVERGEVELQPQNLAEMLSEACDLARNDASLTGIELRLGACEGQVMVDRTQIQQVLLNLIRNAAEAISSGVQDRPGDILVSAIAVGERNKGVCIEVSDNGPGLAPGIADRLYQPFVSSKSTGMGIGLAICQTIVEGHGGTLTNETTLLGGMLFRITLPDLHPHGEHT